MSYATVDHLTRTIKSLGAILGIGVGLFGYASGLDPCAFIGLAFMAYATSTALVMAMVILTGTVWRFIDMEEEDV